MAKHSRRHHIVPQFYLDAFTNDKGHVRVHDKQDGREYETSPINVAVEGDFNRVDVEGYPPDEIESWLSGNEGKAAAALRRMLLPAFPPSRKDRITLSGLMAVQYVRGRAYRSFLNDTFTTIAHKAIEVSAHELSDEELRKALRKGGPGDAEFDINAARERLKTPKTEFVLDQNTHVMWGVSMLPEFAKELASRVWYLVRGKDIITCDEPVHMVSSRTGPVGLRTADEIRFPLSPDYMLAMVHPEAEDLLPESVIDRSQVDSVHWQRAIFANAHRQVIRHPKTPLLVKL